MKYVEYALVGLLVLLAAAYAFWRMRRALSGKAGCDCAFSSDSDLPCSNCPGKCEENEFEND